MKKLCELVDIAVNNENCVVFKVKDNTRMDMITLGCFKGDEDMIRMTKGRTPEITIFNKDGSNYSYHFGEGSTTLISDNMMKQRTMIRECAILDFGLVCDWAHQRKDVDYEKLVKSTLDITSTKGVDRFVGLVSGGGMCCNIRVNEQTMELGINVKDVPGWFEERGYSVIFQEDISNGLKCGVTCGDCFPINGPEKEFDVNDISKERITVLLSNAIDVLNEDYSGDLYEALHSEMGMTYEEIVALGFEECIPCIEFDTVDEVLATAQEKAEEANSKNGDHKVDKLSDKILD